MLCTCIYIDFLLSVAVMDTMELPPSSELERLLRASAEPEAESLPFVKNRETDALDTRIRNGIGSGEVDSAEMVIKELPPEFA